MFGLCGLSIGVFVFRLKKKKSTQGTEAAKMGFTIENFPQPRYTCPLAYVCLSGRPIAVNRLDDFKQAGETAKYSIQCCFSIYYSADERNNKQQPVDMRNYYTRVNELPANLVEYAYNLCKAEFSTFNIVDQL